MKRKFLDTTVFSARKMERDGNVDRGYWLNKTVGERLEAAARMIEVAFQEPLFLSKKVDRSIFEIRRRTL